MHPRNDVAPLYVSRKNSGKGLIGHENSVKSEENGLGWWVKNNIEPLLVARRTSRTITHEKTADPIEFMKLKKNKEKMCGLKKECIDKLLEIQRTCIRTTHGDG